MLNDLAKVLTRFRFGRYACMADLSKYFFQVSVPKNQRYLLRLVWYRNNDLDEGRTQVFQLQDTSGALTPVLTLPCSLLSVWCLKIALTQVT